MGFWTYKYIVKDDLKGSLTSPLLVEKVFETQDVISTAGFEHECMVFQSLFCVFWA